MLLFPMCTHTLYSVGPLYTNNKAHLYHNHPITTANSQRTSTGPMTDTEIQQWESQSRQHAVDAVDALEKPDLDLAEN